jgi:hypothetical protein
MYVKTRGAAIALVTLLSTPPLALCPDALAAGPPASPEAQPASADDAAKRAEAAAAAAARGALIAYVNPESGSMALQPRPGSVPLELSARTLNALNTSFDGLTPVKVGGVTTIDLQGRFSSIWFTVVDSSGKAHAFCVTTLPPEIAAAARALHRKNAENHERGEASRVR